MKGFYVSVGNIGLLLERVVVFQMSSSRVVGRQIVQDSIRWAIWTPGVGYRCAIAYWTESHRIFGHHGTDKVDTDLLTHLRY